MNSTIASPASKKEAETSNFRANLKTAVAQPHAQLESLSIMKRYASGSASIDEYLQVTLAMQAFWCRFEPATRHLALDYNHFFKGYLQALECDLGVMSPPVKVISVHEIAFYYVMLGSGLGAKVILKNNSKNDYPKQNLHYLANHSTRLWKCFISEHLANVPAIDEQGIIEAAKILFEDLLSQMSFTAKVS